MSNKQPQIIIFVGRSGCGKGTQAKLINKKFDFEYLSSGDLLRERAEQNDFSGNKLTKILEKGELAPTFLMFQVWSDKISEIKTKRGLKGLIIDGSPRSLLEAKLMDNAFNWYDWTNIKVILLDISEQEAFDRLTKRRICKQCGRIIPWTSALKVIKICDVCGGQLETREDDIPEAIRARLDFYKKDVQPAVDYYKKKGKLIRIDGDKPIEDVHQDISKALDF